MQTQMGGPVLTTRSLVEVAGRKPLRGPSRLVRLEMRECEGEQRVIESMLARLAQHPANDVITLDRSAGLEVAPFTVRFLR